MTEKGSPIAPGAERSTAPGRGGILKIAGDLMLAGIGIVGIVGDEAQSLYCRSIERGQDAVRSARQRLGSIARPLARKVEVKSPDCPEPAAEAWRPPHQWLNLVRPADIEALNRQIAELEAEIDKLTTE